jgi:chemotaxis protein histidine kinase CheA
MLNGNEWHQLHGDFLSDSQHLLHRADECLSHLELINDDKDAIEALLGALQRIAGLAEAASVTPVAGFSRQLRYLLYFAAASGRLQPKALVLLRQCLSLLSWQVELIDPLTGLLPLDDQEQHELLEQFGCCCGIGTVENGHAMPVEWPATLKRVPAEPAPGEHADRSGAL